ncbi:hypothetical protein [Egicoccus sp. AB-alg2]|uniref:hypothetical protein n=1 Tax=Egicoccus sp. AB-alg2 TaxID=3242693 RepID=UPI00359E154B
MIHLHTTAAPTATTPAGGRDTPTTGDFLALLAALVGGITSEATEDGAGALFPGTPLLADPVARDGEAAGRTAQPAAPPDEPETAEDRDGASPAAGGWPSGPVLAALLALPAPEVAGMTPATTGATSLDAEDGVSVAAEPDEAGVPTSAAPDADVIGVDATTGRATGATTGVVLPLETGGAVGEVDGNSDLATKQDASSEPASAAGVTGATAGSDRRAERAAADPARPRLDGLDGQTAETAAVAGPRGHGEVRGRTTSTSMGAAISRVLDALEQLEAAPPPRQVTLELGDLRVRVALEDGNVRLQVLGDQRDAAREFVRAATDALRERGFDLGRDQGERARDGHPPSRPDVPAANRAGRGTATTTATTAGTRPGVHL